MAILDISLANLFKTEIKRRYARKPHNKIIIRLHDLRFEILAVLVGFHPFLYFFSHFKSFNRL